MKIPSSAVSSSSLEEMSPSEPDSESSYSSLKFPSGTEHIPHIINDTKIVGNPT